MSYTIERNDITKMCVDAIVNAANTELQMGGGVCGTIFRAAGASELQSACDKLAPIKTSEAVITDGFQLHAKYVIHTAGPVFHDGHHNEEKLLRLCYLNALSLAVEHGCESIAFPLISSGIFGYPKAEALRVATAAIRDFLIDHDIAVTLVVFGKDAFSLSKKLLGDVQSYIDEHYVQEFLKMSSPRRSLDVERAALEEIRGATPCFSMKKKTLSAPKNADVFINKLDEPFSETLLRLIDAKGRTDVEVYKRANIDRKLFSKIRTVKNYMPSKKTAVALAVALELNLGETKDLLERAGYTLSRSVLFDVIVEYFIQNRKYDIFEINDVLFYYDQPILG